MPDKKTVDRAREDLREGKGPSTAAGEFVREEMHHIREGKHGAKSTRQAIAIGLSKARKAGVPLKPPAEGSTSAGARQSAQRDYKTGQGDRKPRSSSRARSRATSRALRSEGNRAASRSALSRQAKLSAERRQGTSRSPKAAGKRAAATRRRMGTTRVAAQKAARTRRRKARAA